MPLLVGTVRQPSKVCSFFADDPFEFSLAAPPVLEVGGQEDQAAPVLLLVREPDLGLVAGLLQKGVGHLDENAGAVAGVILAAAGAAVAQIDEDRERIADDGVGFAALDVDHEADAAGVVLMLRVVKPLLGRRSVPLLVPAAALFVCFGCHCWRTAVPGRIKLNFNSFHLNQYNMQYII